MKIINLLMMIACVSVAQAETSIYKCPGKVEGKFTYQASPCVGGKVGEHTIKIIPSDEKRIAEAQAKLASDIEAQNKEKKDLPFGIKTVPVNPNAVAGKVPATTGAASFNPTTTANPVVAPTDGATTPAAVVAAPAPVTPTPVPVAPTPAPK